MNQLSDYISEKLIINTNSKYTTKYSYYPKSKQNLRNIIVRKLDKNENADLNDIDISNINDFSNLFSGLQPKNIDISGWNVSHVKNMRGMFYKCYKFNSDISNWDVSNVEDMSEMFSGCNKFNCNLDKWNVSNHTQINNMFNECKSLENKPSWYNHE